MIIEAGYDLHMLFDLELSRSKRESGVWAIAMDEDLILCSLSRVRGANPATLGDNLSKIAKTLRNAGIGIFRLLGTCLFDVDGNYSSIPRYSFRDYVGLEYLPRAGSWPGPHAVVCDCPACLRFEERLRRNRERHRVESGNEES